MKQDALRYFALMLDPRDPAESLLIALLDAFQARQMSRNDAKITSDKHSLDCAICGWQGVGYATEQDARRALSAHKRQMHRDCDYLLSVGYVPQLHPQFTAESEMHR